MEASKARPKIAELRDKAGLTQLELSRRVGVTETTISNWEKGRSGIEWLERVIRLCKALDCYPDDLIEYIHASEAEDTKDKKGQKSLIELQNRLGTAQVPSSVSKK